MTIASPEALYAKRQLKFRVKGQKIFREFDSKPIISGSKGYLEAVFEFDSTWTGLRKFIAFLDEQGKEYAFELKGNKCDIPDEVTDGRKFSLYLVGLSLPKVKIQTPKVSVYQKGV